MKITAQHFTFDTEDIFMVHPIQKDSSSFYIKVDFKNGKEIVIERDFDKMTREMFFERNGAYPGKYEIIDERKECYDLAKKQIEDLRKHIIFFWVGNYDGQLNF